VSETLHGIVINLNRYGGTVRLDDGDIASANPVDVETHRNAYERSLTNHQRLSFEVRRDGRRRSVLLAPQIVDEALEEKIAAYIRDTEEWETPDAPPAAERHFLKKKKRAAIFAKRAP
jgi:hypothetical protein